MSHKRVLIIDDEEAIQTVVQFGLNMAVGWEVLTASSGPEGISRAQSEQPDMILLDVMMPDMDGLTTFQQLRQQPETQTIPVILLTAKAQASEKRIFQTTGVNGVITKPFNSLELAAQIVRILDW
ncbi:response regulator [filamentous cyanobacterium LEGE 11480]|uniref:Response regulator n=1 Tax=Romeriopsis navalis LEGE 11480 TaxID=2777977 RepID=A0A928VM62_9CYAN|nr:response regulator [Romeriopsis navalis]MBE9029201.1 response regulator [Romeriopsis navalis LEGE 11480]